MVSIRMTITTDTNTSHSATLSIFVYFRLREILYDRADIIQPIFTPL